MDVPRPGDKGLIDFPGDIIKLHEKLGFYFVARHAVWKEPLGVRLRTMTRGLAHKQIVDDSSLCDVAQRRLSLDLSQERQESDPDYPPNRAHVLCGRARDPSGCVVIQRMDRQANREPLFALDMAAICLGLLGRCAD